MDLILTYVFVFTDIHWL